MAKDTMSQSERSSGQGGRRKPVTIDAPAGEAVRKPSPAEAPPASVTPEERAAIPSSDSHVEEKTETTAGANAKGEPPPARPDKAEPIIPSAFAGARAPERNAHRHQPQPAAAPARRSALFLPLLLAGLAGGAVAALLFLVLVRGGLLAPPGEEGAPDLTNDLAALRSEVAELRQAGDGNDLAALRAEVADLRQAGDGSELAALREQVAGLEQGVEQLRGSAPAPTDQAALAGIEARLTELEAKASESTAVSSVSSADLSELKQSIAGVEQSVAGLREEMGQLSARLDNAPTTERLDEIEARLGRLNESASRAAALGPAVAADALAAALEAGRPFERELAALRSLGLDEETIQGLAPHAGSGLPTSAALRASFEAAIGAIDLSDPAPPGSSVMDRLIQSAQGLVAVRPAQPTEGTEPTAVVTRIRGALQAGDLATALAEREALPESARAATADWAQAAEARREAEALVARLRGEALSQLESQG